MFASGKTAAVSSEANYIEDVFSTYLWTTSSSDQTLTTGIDMTKGALTWLKGRSNAISHILQTGVGGGVLPNNALSSNNTNAYFGGNYRIADSTTGFTVGTDYYTGTPETAVAWTFRKQPKFFDVVTYTGDGTTPREIAHNLTSAPGCVMVKRTDSTTDWSVWHTSTGNDQNGQLNLTNAFGTYVGRIKSVTSTTFTVGDAGTVNASGGTYVAYLFAHNAGGFGLTGTDNVISCGSYTGTGSDMSVTLGYEPQYVMIKRTDSTGDWWIGDTMRGFNLSGVARLEANTSDAEAAIYNGVQPTSTGFFLPSGTALNGGGDTFIYIAIRRGPMKVPTSGTSVFAPTTWTGTGAALQQNVGINYDSFMQWRRNGGYSTPWMDKLRGFGYSIYTQSTNTEVNQTAYIAGPKQNNYINFVDGTYNLSGEPWLNYAFVRAPGFHDEVCYTGNGVNGLQVTHNLGVAPELIIIKSRGNANWQVSYSSNSYDGRLYLNTTDALLNSGLDPVPASGTASYITVRAVSTANSNNVNYVAYLFATCAGVSKVGSYTGTGTTLQVDCGFTGGARFVLIKRTDSTGDWYVWDSARGIVAGNDPYLLLNSTAAEVTSTDYIDTYSAGFEISSTAPAAINASGGTFIFLAIA